jgi:scyllo-inositol 2-dehydrogenase (NADP+)
MKTSPETQAIQVGLVGFGLAGRTFHAPMIGAVHGLNLAAIVQRRGDDAQESYPEARVVRSVEELLKQESIRLVVIATPNLSHFALARQLLLAGRDVVIDKPMATTYEEAAELTRLAKECGRVLSVYHNRRWDGDFKTVRELLSAGALGQVKLYESHFDRYRPLVREGAWRERSEPGSGVLFDLGPHLIDQALVLFGEPKAVSADVRVERKDAVVDDAFDITLHYPGMRAWLRATMLASRPGPRFLIHGVKASYVKYGLDPQEAALKRGERPKGAGWGVEPSDWFGKLVFADGDVQAERTVSTQPGDYRGFYENVRDTLNGQASLAVTAQQALRVMWVLELSRQSSGERRVIEYR